MPPDWQSSRYLYTVIFMQRFGGGVGYIEELLKEASSELCQTSKVKLFTNIVNDWKRVTVLETSS